MNFDDDFESDNNPFAGSTHFLSNGIDHFNNFLDARNGVDQLHHQAPILAKDTTSLVSNVESDTESVDEMDTTTELASEQPTVYKPSLQIDISQHINNLQSACPISITTFQINKDFKNSKTVFYKIENSITKTCILRRYNDFKSLRTYLSKFYPYLFIPPIPEKHSFSRFFKDPLNYKIDITIIELRIRLLNYFLYKLHDNTILFNSIILNKFLDPLITEWTSCLSKPPFTNLSSNSILLIQSQNPTKLSAYFSYLPTPPSHLLKTFNSTLNNDVFRNLESNLNYFLRIAISLEMKTKHLINNLNALRIDMIKFGGFLNIFSIVENQNHNIEKFGNKIDLNFINIEILIKNLVVKIKEPAIILKNSLLYLLHMLHFRKLKELQLVYFKNIILKKQTNLKKLIDTIAPSTPAQQAFSINTLNSPSINLVKSNIQHKSESHLIHLDNLNSGRKQSMLSKINFINNEISSNLIPCYKELKVDVQFLCVQLEKNIKNEFKNLLVLLINLMNNWCVHVYGDYLISCMKIWLKKQKNLN